MTALKLGCDLATVCCSVEAAVPIKSYSPELMVRPLLIPKILINQSGISELCGPQKSEQEVIQASKAAVVELFDRTSALVIGPGKFILNHRFCSQISRGIQH
jgi:NAD(P)H-hydrate repair Nnr-like enzyme with NAD(P)H-hydrate dehydratase domain